MRYAVVIERASSNFSASVPGLPGCIATGRTAEETEREIREAMTFHIEGSIAEGLPVAPATTVSEYVESGAP